MPKVSIIIPVYNVEKYLRKCLDSIVNQTIKDIEIICINDGSTDNSLDILKEYQRNDKRIHIINQENAGVAIARNKGLDIASGKYIMFIDSDDYVDSKYVETPLKHIEKTNSDIVQFAVYCVINDTPVPRWDTFLINCLSQTNVYKLSDLINFQHFIYDKIYKRDFIEKNKIRFIPKLKTAEDGIFNLMCLYNTPKYIIIKDILYFYRVDRKHSATSKALKGIRCDLQAYTTFISTQNFKQATEPYKKFTLIKMIGGILYFENKTTSLAEKIKFSLLLNKYLNFINDNFSKDILEDCKDDINRLRKISIFKYVTNTIFSVVNKNKDDGKYKQITIFGLKLYFKLKSSTYKQYKKFIQHKVKNNSVLLIEANVVHGECLPSHAKHLKELGYNVDVIVTPGIDKENPFCLSKSLCDHYFVLNLDDMNKVFKSNLIQEYKYGIIASHYLYYGPSIETAPSFFDFFAVTNEPQNGFIIFEHHLDRCNPIFMKEKRVLRLADFDDNNSNFPSCSNTYCGEFKFHNKNKITNFISIGELSAFRRNSSLLIEAVSNLVANGIDNFKITIIGNGTLENLPKNIASKFEIKGRLPFKDMYEEIANADYLLTLLDPENVDHDRYTKNGISGSFSISYSFDIPCLIPSKFAPKHYFNNSNAIIYDNNSELSETMQKCINMDNTEYSKIKNNLQNTVDTISKKSEDNLKSVLNHRRYQIISLGCDCLPRTVVTKTGLEKTKSQGKLSLPFDLAVSPSEAILKLLNNNFKNYLKYIKYSKKDNLYINKKYYIRYNHDTDCPNTKKGRNKIIQRYKSRIQNLKAKFNTDDFIFFIINNPPNENICNEINKAIKDIRGEKDYKLIALDIDCKFDTGKIDSSISVFNKKHPFEHPWDWWLEKNNDLFNKYSEDIGQFIMQEIRKQNFEPLNYRNLNNTGLIETD